MELNAASELATKLTQENQTKAPGEGRPRYSVEVIDVMAARPDWRVVARDPHDHTKTTEIKR